MDARFHQLLIMRQSEMLSDDLDFFLRALLVAANRVAGIFVDVFTRAMIPAIETTNSPCIPLICTVIIIDGVTIC